jgi:hypothetical protein
MDVTNGRTGDHEHTTNAVVMPKLDWQPSPNWSNGVPIVRHIELGRAGGNHTDPTEDLPLCGSFLKMVGPEVERGGFRATWGRGSFKRIDV